MWKSTLSNVITDCQHCSLFYESGQDKCDMCTCGVKANNLYTCFVKTFWCQQLIDHQLNETTCLGCSWPPCRSQAQDWEGWGRARRRGWCWRVLPPPHPPHTGSEGGWGQLFQFPRQYFSGWVLRNCACSCDRWFWQKYLLACFTAHHFLVLMFHGGCLTKTKAL